MWPATEDAHVNRALTLTWVEMGRPHWLGPILYITFMEKMVIISCINLWRKVFLFLLNNRAAPWFREGWGRSIMGDGIHDNILA